MQLPSMQMSLRLEDLKHYDVVHKQPTTRAKDISKFQKPPPPNRYHQADSNSPNHRGAGVRLDPIVSPPNSGLNSVYKPPKRPQEMGLPVAAPHHKQNNSMTTRNMQIITSHPTSLQQQVAPSVN